MWTKQTRSAWQYRGQERPPLAVVPEPGQESVWDYPRPPRIASDGREVIVRVGVHEIARSRRSVRLLETASPPTFYVPPDDVRTEFLEMEAGASRCEWKGEARYWSVMVPGRRVIAAAWSYADPLPGYERIRGYFAFYPSLPHARSIPLQSSRSRAGSMAGGSRRKSSGPSRVNPDPRAGEGSSHFL